MTGLLFAHPEWLGQGITWVAAVSAALFWAIIRSRRFVRRLLGSAAFQPEETRRAGFVRAAGDVGLLLALVSVLIGLLGPRVGRELVPLSTSGIDIVMLLDASRSMDARDVPPSRIAAARRQLVGLLGSLAPGDRAALAVFAGRGVILTPLTSDHLALREMIAAIDTSLVRHGGSDLPAGITTALAAFEPSNERPRAVFVLTDGEALGLPIGAATVAALRANTQVFAAAFGTREGATIPDHGAPLRDASGEIVRSSRRLASLESITRRTGGALFVTDEWGHFDIALATASLRAPVASAPGDFVDHLVTVAVVVPFAAAALLLLCLEIALRSLRPGAARVLAVTALCTLTLAADESPPERPAPAAQALVRSGLEDAARGEWPRAEAHFRAAALAARDRELSAIAFHDAGVAALQQRRLEEARHAFFESLAATGSSSDPARVARTQWNLEWVLRRLENSQEPELPTIPQRPTPDQTKPHAKEPDLRQRREPAQTATASSPRSHEPPTPQRTGASTRSPAKRASTPLEGTRALNQRERSAWLERVDDDPRRAFRTTAFEHPLDRGKRPTGKPTW